MRFSKLKYNVNIIMLTPIDVTNYQTKWGNAITDISQKYLKKQDYINAALDAITELYAYDYDRFYSNQQRLLKKGFVRRKRTPCVISSAMNLPKILDLLLMEEKVGQMYRLQITIFILRMISQ